MRAVIFLATQAGNEEKMGVKQIAEALGVPRQYLAKILQQLARNNFVASVKGPHGGFYLKAKNLDVPLLHIIKSMDGELALSSCIIGLPSCSTKNPCALHYDFYTCREGFNEVLAQKSLKDFSSR